MGIPRIVQTPGEEGGYPPAGGPPPERSERTGLILAVSLIFLAVAILLGVLIIAMMLRPQIAAPATSTPWPSAMPTFVPEETRRPSSPTATEVSLPTVAPPTATPTPRPASPTPTRTPLPPTPTQYPLPTWTPALPSPTFTPWPTQPVVTGWRGEYYANGQLSGAPTLIRDDPMISFNWGAGAPDPSLPADYFSARWTRRLYFDAGLYRFVITVDDGARLWINGQLVIDAWTVGSLRSFERDMSLPAGHHTIQLDYFEQSGVAAISLTWGPLAPYPDWKGEYYSNPNLAGAPVVTRNDAGVDFDWGTGAPAAGLPADQFSVRWTRSLAFAEGPYRFHTLVDDGVRLWIDGQLVIDQWVDGSAREHIGHRYLVAGQHEVRVEYYDRAGPALIRLWWEMLTHFPEWKGEYYPNMTLTWPPALIRNDPVIGFDWTNAPPETGMPSTQYSVRWTQQATFGLGMTRFHIGADDGIRVWLDQELIADRWQNQSYEEWMVDRSVSPGVHTVRVEYYQWLGAAKVTVWWELLPFTVTPTAIPPSPTPTRSPQTPTIPPTSTATRPRPTSTPEVWPTLTPEPAGGRVVTVQPPAAQPGATVTVQGTNWRAGVPVNVGIMDMEKGQLRPTWLTVATPAADGSFKSRLTLSSQWQDRDGVLIVAAERESKESRLAWLPLGRAVTFQPLNLGEYAPRSAQPYVRIYTTVEEWQQMHKPVKSKRPALLRGLIERLGLSPGEGTVELRLDWERYIVAEVYLGPVPANSLEVEIVQVAKTPRNVQVIFRAAPPPLWINRPGTDQEKAMDYPASAVLIPRAELPSGIKVAFVFITTQGQRLPQLVVTL